MLSLCHHTSLWYCHLQQLFVLFGLAQSSSHLHTVWQCAVLCFWLIWASAGFFWRFFVLCKCSPLGFNHRGHLCCLCFKPVLWLCCLFAKGRSAVLCMVSRNISHFLVADEDRVLSWSAWSCSIQGNGLCNNLHCDMTVYGELSWWLLAWLGSDPVGASVWSVDVSRRLYAGIWFWRRSK